MQGQTAYIEASPGQPHAASLGDNALALRVFIEASCLMLAKDPLVEKLANYVAGPSLGRSSHQMWYSFSSEDAVFAMLGLASYDRIEGSGSPHLALKVRSEDSDQYHVDGLDPKFYNLKMGESTRRTIADAFLIDEVCLGYSTEMFLDDADMPQRRSDVP